MPRPIQTRSGLWTGASFVVTRRSSTALNARSHLRGRQAITAAVEQKMEDGVEAEVVLALQSAAGPWGGRSEPSGLGPAEDCHSW